MNQCNNFSFVYLFLWSTHPPTDRTVLRQKATALLKSFLGNEALFPVIWLTQYLEKFGRGNIRLTKVMQK